MERRPLPSILVGRDRPERIDGAALTRRRYSLARLLDAHPGYHRLEVEGPGLAASALVISAPRRCPDPGRGWGAFAPLHAVRTETDWGVATYRELAELGDWIGGLGGAFIGTLPLNAGFLDGPVVEPSPYRPASRLAWNELYVDVERLPELGASPEARALLASAGLRRRLVRLRSAPSADPVATMAVKRQVLELLAEALAAGPSPRRRALEAFLAERPEVKAYARFRAATETLGRPWTAWAESRPGQIPAGAADERRVRYHCYAQWVADSQLAEAATHGGLYLDLPVGVHPDGFDPWWHPDAFATGVTGGAPPDSFQGAGQNWAVIPLHPEGIRQDAYRYPIALLRHAMRHAATVRIDHVMGLHRLWWIPEGMAAVDGAYVRYRAEELRAIAVLEASRAGVAVVGEDLGTVAPSVRAAMRRDGMLRSHVHQFAATPDDPLPDPPPDSLASLGTHDLPPFAAWWAGLDIHERVRRGELTPEVASAQRAERAALQAAAGHPTGRPASPGRALRFLLLHLAAGPARLHGAGLTTSGPGTGSRWPSSGSSTWPGGAGRGAPTPKLRETPWLRSRPRVERRPGRDRQADRTRNRADRPRSLGAHRRGRLPLQRGDPSPPGRQARRPPAGPGRHGLRCLGPWCPCRQRDRGLQRLGSRRRPSQPPSLLGDLGGCGDRRHRGRCLQVRHHH